MTKSQKTRAAKKADTALCKIEDLFYYDLPDSIIAKVSRACDSLREIISNIENSQPKS